eukprot:286923_1
MTKSKDNPPNTPLVVFDWDDTLFPTTELKNDIESCARASHDIESLTQSIHELLIKCIRLFGASNLIIVTNGTQKWVLKSLQILNNITHGQIPSVALIYRLISEDQLSVISGQKAFAKRYPKQTHLWKRMIFMQLLRNRVAHSHANAAKHTKIKNFKINN